MRIPKSWHMLLFAHLFFFLESCVISPRSSCNFTIYYVTGHENCQHLRTTCNKHIPPTRQHTADAFRKLLGVICEGTLRCLINSSANFRASNVQDLVSGTNNLRFCLLSFIFLFFYVTGTCTSKSNLSYQHKKNKKTQKQKKLFIVH